MKSSMTFIIWLLAMSTVMAQGIKPERPSDTEVGLLPPFCKTKFDNGLNRSHPDVRRWMNILGPEYEHIHHYCFGLNFYYRAGVGDNNKDYYLRRAMDNYNYLIEHSRPDFILLPEVYVKRGQVYRSMGDTARAIQDFRKARDMKPDYLKPYAVIGDTYLQMGEKEKAREAWEQGLKVSPQSKALGRRIKSLD